MRLVKVGLVIVLVLCVVASVGAAAYPIAYNDRIYPGVSVHDVDLVVSVAEPVGGLTVEEATAALVESLPDPSAQVVELRLGEQAWQLSWADAGQGYDYAGTAEAAYQVARQGSWYEQIRLTWETRLQGHRVAPLTIPADPARSSSGGSCRRSR